MHPFSEMRFVWIVVCVASLLGCHRSKIHEPDPDAEPPDDAGVDLGRRGREAGPTDGGTRYDVYVDPGCDGGRASDGGMRMYECDPLIAGSCGPGLACYATAVPPTEPCGDDTFVSFCAPPGPGTQGDDCLGHNDCGAEHLCVVTGAGTQCTRACDPGGGAPRCPRGFLCRSTDVPGYGACF